MDNFMLSFSVVFPLLLYMLLGGGIRRAGILKVEAFRELNGMIFKIMIPAMLFTSIYHSNLKESLNKGLFFYICGMVLLVFLFLCVLVPRFVKEKEDASVMIQGIMRSNYVLFGITIGMGVFPDGNIGVMMALAAFVVPLFNVLSVILFESFRGERVKTSTVILGAAKNPLVAAGVLGIFAAVWKIPLPKVFDNTLEQIGDMASPLALICLGGMLSFKSMKVHAAKISAVLLGRLLIVPFLAVAGGIALGYRNIELTAVLAVFAAPTAVASVPMAQALGGNEKLAGEQVAAGSAACILTIFLFIWALRELGYIT